MKFKTDGDNLFLYSEFLIEIKYDNVISNLKNSKTVITIQVIF